MNSSFDPQADWLHLGSTASRPSYYELLNLPCFENDPERIRSQYLQICEHLHLYQLGNYAEAADRFRGEIAQAFRCLMDPASKLEYDRELREHIAADPASPVPTTPIVGSGDNSAGAQSSFGSFANQSVVTENESFRLAGSSAQTEDVPGGDHIPPNPNASIRELLSGTIADENAFLRKSIGIVAATSGVLILPGFYVDFVGPFMSLVFITFGLWWVVLVQTSPVRKLRRQLQTILKNIERRLNATRRTRRKSEKNLERQLRSLQRELKLARRSYESLPEQRSIEYAELVDRAEQVQRENHLKQCFISRGNIPQISSSRAATLAAYGVVTAWDISPSSIANIPGFGPALTSRLLAWRFQMEAAFQFYEKNLTAAIQHLDEKYARLRAQYEEQLRRGPDKRREIAASARREIERIDLDIAELEKEQAEAQADLSAFDKKN